MRKNERRMTGYGKKLLWPGLYLTQRRFTAGTNINDAINYAAAMPKGITPIFNLLGEHFDKPRGVEQAVIKYMAFIKAYDKTLPPCRLSVKLSQIGLNLKLNGPQIAEAFLQAILDTAEEKGILVEIDTEESETLNDAHRVILDLIKENPTRSKPRVAVSARRFRSQQDLYILNCLHIPVRLVKGAYFDNKNSSAKNIRDIKERFMICANRLLISGTQPAFATHDLFLIEKIIELARAYHFQNQQIEFQFLKGLRPKTQTRLLQQGYPVAQYIPFGELWHEYALRRWKFFLKNPAEIYNYLYN